MPVNIRAKNALMIFLIKTKKKEKIIIKMAIINRRNSVGTTQKPTSTNKIKRLPKDPKTNTSRRRELVGETTRRVLVTVQTKTRNSNLERKGSKSP